MKHKSTPFRIRTLASRTAASAICFAFLSAATLGAHAQDKPNSPDQEKFVFAGLVGLVSSSINIFQAVSNWVTTRTQGADSAASSMLQAGATPIVLAPVGQNTGSGQGQLIPYNQAPSFNPAPLIMGQPDMPLYMQQAAFDSNKPWDGKANYQGVSIAAVMLDAQNRVMETRSLSSAFRTGERFKLRLVSTSDAIVSLDALKAQPGSIAANGIFAAAPAWAGQLYPPRADQVVLIKAGDVVHIPVGSQEYFMFDGQPGTDLLSLNVRHPKATSAQMNRQPVYRQDAQGMTVYSQLAQEGMYLALTQVLALQHGR